VKKKMATEKISFRLPYEQKKIMEQMAEQMSVDVSVVYRMAISSFIWSHKATMQAIQEEMKLNIAPLIEEMKQKGII